jgi:hypothetical protein
VAFWWWVLIWVVALAMSGCLFFVLGRSLWRKASVLFTEMSVAAERLSAVSEGLAKIAEQSAEPAVFADPSRLRQERFLAQRTTNQSRQSVR